jgi:hypothetical protein
VWAPIVYKLRNEITFLHFEKDLLILKDLTENLLQMVIPAFKQLSSALTVVPKAACDRANFPESR